MIIGYARCSTADQTDSLAAQEAYLKEKMNAETVYKEIASGLRVGRPELTKALAYARSGDSIVVQRLDRLARSVSELTLIVNDLGNRRIHLRSGHENLDTESAAGKLIFHIFCSLAEFEAALIRERTMAGLEYARARGRVGGRPKKFDPDTEKIVAAALADGKIPVRKLASLYGASVNTLYAAKRRAGN